MPAKIYRVRLSDEAHAQLIELVSKGKGVGHCNALKKLEQNR